MDKVVKVKGIVSRPLQARYLEASAEDRAALLPVIAEERGWMLERMAAKGYVLEATVAEVLGVFTRGPARGTMELVGESAEAAPS